MAAPTKRRRVFHQSYTSSDATELRSICVYFAPPRIPRARLEILTNAATTKNVRVSTNICADVTHVIAECESIDQLYRLMKWKDETWSKHVHFVNTSWFTETMKHGHLLEVTERYRIKEIQEPNKSEDGLAIAHTAKYECQRSTPLKHFNERFTQALELVQEYRELRDEHGDQTRALAFRHASCTLKSLKYPITNIRQIKNLPFIGDHSFKIIKDILDYGTSPEVEKLNNEEEFQKLKLFCSIYGVGSVTAKRWIERGLTTIQDVKMTLEKELNPKRDSRLNYGIAFHEDINTPVTITEAELIKDIVSQEAKDILPDATVELTGGFRRGKSSGHDVDLLISHPEDGREVGLLERVLARLASQGNVLQGLLEKNTFYQSLLEKDSKSQHDHFEKWIGLFTLDKSAHKLAQSCTSVQDLKLAIRKRDINETEQKTDSHGARQRHDSSENRKRSEYSASFQNPEKKTLTELCELSQSDRDWVVRRVDLIIIPKSQYYYGLVGWTGSKQFNRSLRQYASKELNMKLTSHGLYDFTSKQSLPAKSEREVFKNLKLEYREPWERNC